MIVFNNFKKLNFTYNKKWIKYINYLFINSTNLKILELSLVKKQHNNKPTKCVDIE